MNNSEYMMEIWNNFREGVTAVLQDFLDHEEDQPNTSSHQQQTDRYC